MCKAGSWAVGTQSRLEPLLTCSMLCQRPGLRSGSPRSCCPWHPLPLLLPRQLWAMVTEVGRERVGDAGPSQPPYIAGSPQVRVGSSKPQVPVYIIVGPGYKQHRQPRWNPSPPVLQSPSPKCTAGKRGPGPPCSALPGPCALFRAPQGVCRWLVTRESQVL